MGREALRQSVRSGLKALRRLDAGDPPNPSRRGCPTPAS